MAMSGGGLRAEGCGGRNKGRVHIAINNPACTLSIYGIARYRRFFEENGWQVARRAGTADKIIVHTCAYNQEQEERAFKLIERMQMIKKPGAEVIVSGCMPRICEERLRSVFDGVAVGPRNLSVLNEVIDATCGIDDVGEVIVQRRDFAASFLYSANKVIANLVLRGPVLGLHRLFKMKIEPYYKTLASLYDQHKYYIEACVGCLGSCSYCAIRYARGQLKSKPIDQILAEFKKGLSLGYKRVVLLGDDLGFYGKDIGTDLVALLGRLLEVAGDWEILLYYLEPMGLEATMTGLKEMFASGRIIDVNIPIQTGSQRLSKLMNRHYDVDEVMRYVRLLRREFPTLNVRTQIMVGFPGETEEDFQRTVDVYDDFDEVGIFQYSDRPNTASSLMNDKVPAAVKAARARRLRRKYFRNLYLGMLRRVKIVYCGRDRGGVRGRPLAYRPRDADHRTG
jgi:threonylcarbamoyladenosine tRNA methylthiotransferase MtaB